MNLGYLFIEPETINRENSLHSSPRTNPETRRYWAERRPESDRIVTYICVYAYVNVYVYTYVCVCVCVSLYRPIYICVCMCICVYMCVRMRMCLWEFSFGF